MRFEPQRLSGLVLVTPTVHEDPRGFFMESYRRDLFANNGIACEFVQDNHVRSRKGTLRGLHFQRTPGQAKLLRCTVGAVWDVAVDIRPGSPTFGQWFGTELTADNKHQLFVPIGFAHGYSVLSDVAEMQYKVSSVYNPATEAGLAWDDPAIGIDWRVADPLLSERDRTNPLLRNLAL